MAANPLGPSSYSPATLGSGKGLDFVEVAANTAIVYAAESAMNKSMAMTASVQRALGSVAAANVAFQLGLGTKAVKDFIDKLKAPVADTVALQAIFQGLVIYGIDWVGGYDEQPFIFALGEGAIAAYGGAALTGKKTQQLPPSLSPAL